MLLVMALIAGASVLAMATMTGSFEGMRLQSAAKTLAANLRFTRAQALATGRRQQFTIAPSRRAWTAPKERHGEIPGEWRIAFYGAREVQPSAGEGAIVFFPDGGSTGGRVQLGDERAGWNVDVAWLTGEVRLRRAGDAR